MPAIGASQLRDARWRLEAPSIIFRGCSATASGDGAVTLAKNYDPFGVEVSSLGNAITTYGFTGYPNGKIGEG